MASHNDSIKYDRRGHECERLWLQAKIGEYKSVYEMLSDQAGIGFENGMVANGLDKAFAPLPSHSISLH
jgi:hypothetical protein